MEELSFELKLNIEKTKRRLKEFIENIGINNVYISYSGGQDSEILCDIARRLYPDIKIVFCNTGMELPETVKQVMKRKKEGWNLEIVSPKRKFKDVWENNGYPVISKSTSMAINRYRNTNKEEIRQKRLGNVEGMKVGTIPKKWHKLAKEGKFKISERCCDVLKKAPLKNYSKKTGRKPIMGTMKEESNIRSMRLGACNSFVEGKEKSTPIQFWTKENILEYRKEFCVEVSKAYTDLGMERTGCWGCLFGCYKGADENRMLRLEKSHPKLHNFLDEKMNYREICAEIGIEFSKNK